MTTNNGKGLYIYNDVISWEMRGGGRGLALHIVMYLGGGGAAFWYRYHLIQPKFYFIGNFFYIDVFSYLFLLYCLFFQSAIYF